MRKPRDFRTGHLYAVTQRGNHAQWVYRDDADFRKCINLMRRYSCMHQVKIHGYCLLHNHGHWILEASTPESISNFMRDLQGQYSRYLNRRYGTTPGILFAPLEFDKIPAAFSRYLRKGPTNWASRFDAPELDGRGFKRFLKYVEMNSVRCKLAEHPRHWPWSSAQAHCSGQDPHDLLSFDRWEQLYRRPATIAVDWYRYLDECVSEEQAEREWGAAVPATHLVGGNVRGGSGGGGGGAVAAGWLRAVWPLCFVLRQRRVFCKSLLLGSGVCGRPRGRASVGHSVYGARSPPSRPPSRRA